jgi:hypothetical protein
MEFVNRPHNVSIRCGMNSRQGKKGLLLICG